MKEKPSAKKTPSDLAAEVKWADLKSVLIVGRSADGGIFIHGSGLAGGEGVYLSQYVAHYLIKRDVERSTEVKPE